MKIYYEVYGSGEPTVFLLPTWSIIHSRPLEDADPLPRPGTAACDLRRARQRPLRPPESGYDESEFAADALAVMDETKTERAVLVSLSMGAQRALLMAEQPERVDGAVFMHPVPLGKGPADRKHPWNEELDTDEGWAKYNRFYWLKDYRGFLEVLLLADVHRPHSTKPIEDCVGWGLETDARTLIERRSSPRASAATPRELAEAGQVPGAGDQGPRTRSPARAAESRSRRPPTATS